MQDSQGTLTDSECMMPLLAMLKGHVSRLFEIKELKDSINHLTGLVGADSVEPLILSLFYKIGCDGTGGLSQYQQKTSEGKTIDDRKLLGINHIRRFLCSSGCVRTK